MNPNDAAKRSIALPLPVTVLVAILLAPLLLAAAPFLNARARELS